MISLKDLKTKVLDNARLYYDEDAPVMDDSAFDALYEELKAREPGAVELLYRGASSPRNEVAQISTMGSLDKIRDSSDIPPVFRNQAVVVTPKLDGMSVELRYVDGFLTQCVSRRDGETGEDITDTASMMPGVPSRCDLPYRMCRVRGEAVINKEDFRELQAREPRFKSPRNTASGTLRKLDPSAVTDRFVRFKACDIMFDSDEETPDTYSEKLRLLKRAGFDIVEGIGVHLYIDEQELTDALFKIEKARNSDCGPPIDGAVLRINDEKVFNELGRTSNGLCPRGAVAWKYETLGVATKCLDVVWQTGRTGVCVPVAILDPVTLDDCVISRATLNSAQFFDEKNISRNCLVVVRRSNDIIPEITAVMDSPGEKLSVPIECPSCGHVLHQEGAHVKCYHDKCPSKIINRARHMLTVLKVKGLATKTLESLFTAGLLGVKTPADILSITPYQVELAGITGKTAENILIAIRSMQAVPEAVAIRACGFSILGNTLSARLVKNGVSVVDILACKGGLTDELRGMLTSMSGIGDSTINTLDVVFADDTVGFEILERLDSLGKIQRVDTGGPLSGTSWLFTGTLSKPRGEFEDHVITLGGEVASSIRSGLTGLVVGENAGSKKDKAIAREIPIFTEAEFLEYIENRKKGQTDVS